MSLRSLLQAEVQRDTSSFEQDATTSSPSNLDTMNSQHGRQGKGPLGVREYFSKKICYNDFVSEDTRALNYDLMKRLLGGKGPILKSRYIVTLYSKWTGTLIF